MSSTETRPIFIFPGQGSQYPGIGSDLYGEFSLVRDLYDQASDILGYDLATLSFEDPKGEINLTRYTQPVLFTHHIACLTLYRELADNPLTPVATGGHSLGEYSALVAAGSIRFEEGLKLVAKRGELMSDYGEGAMMALTLDQESACTLTDKHYCGIAGLNLPDQTVVGGAEVDLEALAADMAETHPKKRAIPLKTEGAFHTYYMVAAARLFREELRQVDFTPPQIDVLSNYTGTLHDREAESVRSRLFLQLFYPVNWIGCLQSALDLGVTHFVEFGGGIGSGEGPSEKRPNLEGIIKKFTRRSEPKPDYLPVINLESLRAVASKTE